MLHQLQSINYNHIITTDTSSITPQTLILETTCMGKSSELNEEFPVSVYCKSDLVSKPFSLYNDIGLWQE